MGCILIIVAVVFLCRGYFEIGLSILGALLAVEVLCRMVILIGRR